MRISIFNMVLLFTGLQILQAHSLSGQDLKNTRVTIEMNDESLDRLFSKLKERTRFSIGYTNSDLEGITVSFPAVERSVKETLDLALKDQPLSYKLVGTVIMIFKEENQKEKRNRRERDAGVSGKDETFNSAEELLVTISGTVTDASTLQPMPGVNVLVKGTTVGTSTDAEGKYVINAGEDDILVFSFIGYKSVETPVGSRTVIDITLDSDVQIFEEIVVVGYGTMKKSDLTGAIHHVDATQYSTQHTTNMLEMLSGTVAGFNSSQGTSASGGGSMEIRGPTSLAANNNPLIVLDGVIYNGSIGDINPNDIESIDILKDASSAAIFGSRSASGILMVTTKRGRTSKPTINISSKVGLGGVTNQLYPQTPEQYLKGRGDFWAGVFPDKPQYYYSNPNELPSEISLEEWKNYDVTPSDDHVQMWFDRMGMTAVEVENYKAGKTVDWYDLVYRDGLRQDYDISLSGGTQALRYYWSLGYIDNKGVILGDDYKNIRSRINIDADVTSYLSAGVNVQYADRDQSSQQANLGQAIRVSPFGNIFEEDGTTLTFYPYDERQVQNPLLYHELRDKLDQTQTLFATLFGEIKFPLGFSYRVNFTNRYGWGKDFYYDPINTPNGFESQGFGRRIDNSNYEWQVDNIFSWQKTFADVHEFNATFLVNAEKFQSWQSNQENSQFAPSGALSFHALQAGISPSLSNNDEYSTGNALMARLNYSFSSKYMLTGTWRRDGYSAFGQQHPYAEFPSVALGWRISEENFFNVGWIDHLKLRVSWGANGNRAVRRYDALARLGTTKYLYGTTLATGVFSSTMANSDLRWERTEALNFGVDFDLFNVLYGSVEYYDMTTKDLLLDRSLPRIIGYSSVAANLGELGNKGFELTLNSTNVRKENFQWNSSLVFSFNRNKIKHLYGEMVDVLDEEGNVIGQKEADDIANQWFIGESLDRIWDYEVLGVWQLGEEEAAVYGKRPGDMKLRDVNGDDILNPIGDKVFQGYRNPQYRVGLRNDFIVFKNFEISAFIRADLGHHGVNNLHRNSEGNNIYERFNRLYTEYWTEDNPINDYARLNSDASSPVFDYWENRSFVRLQDLSVAYNVPASKLQKFQIQNLKVFLNFRNLITITGWEHYDPESQTLMMPKISSLGISVAL